MKALSIRQPWAWAILHAGKDVENRDWYTPFRGKFAIHAAKGMTREEYEMAREIMVGDIGLTDMPLFGQCQRGAIVGVAYITDCVQASNSPWFEGLWGFEMENAIALPEPIPFKGALGFWDVPADIEQQIQEQLRKGK